MKEKYQFLLSLQVLAYEINTLITYAKECQDCIELLRKKLDDLCQFITTEENIRQWRRWEQHCEIREYATRLRDISIRGLCDIEKHQSVSVQKSIADSSAYMVMLTDTVEQELATFTLDKHSRVLFIGAGAFPHSVLSIARKTGAMVTGVDIDREAVILAKNVVRMAGLDALVQVTHESLHELAFTKVATHVVIASLVENKCEILAILKEKLPPNAKVMIRYGNGLKSIFNYPLEANIISHWVKKEVSNSNTLYDTVVLEKASAFA